MSSLRIILLPMICLMLSACTQYWNRYGEREDTVTLSAGDAVASNVAVQIPTPWPRYSNDTTIAMDGERIARAVARYREGEKQPVATVPELRYTGPRLGTRTRPRKGLARRLGRRPGRDMGLRPRRGRKGLWLNEPRPAA